MRGLFSRQVPPLLLFFSSLENSPSVGPPLSVACKEAEHQKIKDVNNCLISIIYHTEAPLARRTQYVGTL